MQLRANKVKQLKKKKDVILYTVETAVICVRKKKWSLNTKGTNTWFLCKVVNFVIGKQHRSFQTYLSLTEQQIISPQNLKKKVCLEISRQDH